MAKKKVHNRTMFNTICISGCGVAKWRVGSVEWVWAKKKKIIITNQ